MSHFKQENNIHRSLIDTHSHTHTHTHTHTQTFTHTDKHTQTHTYIYQLANYQPFQDIYNLGSVKTLKLPSGCSLITQTRPT